MQGISFFFEEGRRDEVVVFCHGFLGDKWQKGMFKPVARRLEEEGYGILAFDFRGCGESEDCKITLESLKKDAENALRFVESKGKKPILLGFSLGGLVAMLFSERAKALILIAPVSYAINARQRFSSRKHYSKVEGGWKIRGKREYLVGEELVRSLESLDSKRLLKEIKRPTIFIQGSEDEAIDSERTREAATMLEARFVLLEGEGHILSEEGSRKAAEEIVNFLGEILC